MQQVDHPVGSARPNRPPPPSSATATSRRTIRLPDLSSAAPTSEAAATAAASASAKPLPASKPTVSSTPAPWSTRAPLPAEPKVAPSTNDSEGPLTPVSEAVEPGKARARQTIGHYGQQVRQLAMQPKVGLALATAIIVQLVLSWAFSTRTPDAEPADRPALQNRRIAADAPPAEPAARIVAPPAAAPTPSTGVPDAGEAVAVPLGSGGDGAERWPADAGTAPAETAHHVPPAPLRMAENVRPGSAAPQFDGQARRDTAGATLDALVPLDPAENEAPGGNP